MATSAALNAVKKFRLHELNGLQMHNKRYGFLPIPTNSDLSAVHLRNPFLPFLNPKSGRWAPPKYSLRRQAELIKAAKAADMVHMLPPGPKLRASEIEKAAKAKLLEPTISAVQAAAQGQADMWKLGVVWVGDAKEKEVKGADLGTRLYSSKKRMFKGHKWERFKRKRFNHRKILLRDMDERIRRFKEVRFDLLVTSSSTQVFSSTAKNCVRILWLFHATRGPNYHSSLYLITHIILLSHSMTLVFRARILVHPGKESSPSGEPFPAYDLDFISHYDLVVSGLA